MKKIITLFIYIILVAYSWSQSVNQLNENGKKIGFWEVKLDENLIPTKSESYSYIVYNRYDENGDSIYIYERNINKLFKIKDSLQTNIDNLEKQKLLTGTVIVYAYNENEGLLPIRTEKYKNGHPIFIENKNYNKCGDLINTYTFDFLCPCRDEGFSYQTTKNGIDHCFYNGPHGWDSYYVSTLPLQTEMLYYYKYPYFENTPPLVGLTAGYNFLRNNQIEVGIMVNLDYNRLRTGGMAGFHLSYARPLSKNLNTIGLDMGVYSPLTLGIGINSNFDNQKNHILGFKVFGGVTFYHTSLIYEYNMFKNSKNTILDLNHHALKLRVTIPLFRIWK